MASRRVFPTFVHQMIGLLFGWFGYLDAENSSTLAVDIIIQGL